MNRKVAGEIIQFKNCYILRNHKIIYEDFWVRDGKIINPEDVFFDEKKKPSKQFDCNGALICPGFIDIQINGGFGVDFSERNTATPDNLERVAKGILAHGVTAFCPTLVTLPKEVYEKILPVIKKKQGGKHGATILGIHLEGPFINPEKKGAHSLNCIQTFKKGADTLLEIYTTLEDVVLLTLAPEIEGAIEVIESLVNRGIVVSLGHSQASLEQAESAFKHGASLITHLFNAMLPFHHRDPGLVGLLASDIVQNERTVYFGIIADGVHTHPAALRMAHRIHPQGLILVTDAISALGFEEGAHTIGQKSIQIKNGCAFISGTDTLCGSIANMNFSVKNFKRITGCTVVEALEAATLHPAMALNIADRKGTLNFGSDADFLLLTNELDVLSTWISGECVYERKPLSELMLDVNEILKLDLNDSSIEEIEEPPRNCHNRIKIKCSPTFVGHCMTVKSKNSTTIRTCSALHCHKCDFSVSSFADYVWIGDVEYFFLRTNMPDLGKVSEKLKRKNGAVAYACHCTSYSAEQLLPLHETNLPWFCRGHFQTV